MQRYAVIVDPLSTGQEYPGAFRSAGIEPVAVLSSAEPVPTFRASWHPENFRHVHAFDIEPVKGDLTTLAEAVRPYQPLCVIPGSEVGVELAEALVEAVLPGTGNVPELAAARRDKWAMAQALARAGLAHPRQLCTDDPAEVDSWLRATGLLSGRLVLKPARSCATDNVHIAGPGEDWRPLFDQIYGQLNLHEQTNDVVLVQEFVEGVEYMVDSYSTGGKHGLVDVCRYTKSRRGDRLGVYDLVDFLPPDHAEVAAVWPYVQHVLDAVGIRNGCGHTEVILTGDGPRFIDVGARPAGGGHQMITELATGTNQIRRHVAHLAHGQFSDSYQLIQRVCSVVISAPQGGIWRNAELFAGVEQLPTYYTKHFYYDTGDVVPPAGALFDMLGWVVLASTDSAAVDADYRHIKDLEHRIQVDPVQPVASS